MVCGKSHFYWPLSNWFTKIFQLYIYQVYFHSTTRKHGTLRFPQSGLSRHFFQQQKIIQIALHGSDPCFSCKGGIQNESSGLPRGLLPACLRQITNCSHNTRVIKLVQHPLTSSHKFLVQYKLVCFPLLVQEQCSKYTDYIPAVYLVHL